MENVNRQQWPVFAWTCVIIALLLLLKAWALKPLYIDATVRQRTMTLIEGTAARKGWLLSGVELQQVRWGSARFVYRSHVRGDDTIECYKLNLYNGALTPCAK